MNIKVILRDYLGHMYLMYHIKPSPHESQVKALVIKTATQ